MPLGTFSLGNWFLKDAIMATFWVLFSLGSFGLSSVVFWRPLGCLGCLWTAIGAPFLTFRESIGAPLERHWAPFVACGASIGRLSGSLGVTFGYLGHHFERNFSYCSDLKTFEDLYIFVWRNNTKTNPNCELDPLFVGPNALHINSFTRLLWRNPNFYDTKLFRQKINLKIEESCPEFV